jgi:hypothetical protein
MVSHASSPLCSTIVSNDATFETQLRPMIESVGQSLHRSCSSEILYSRQGTYDSGGWKILTSSCGANMGLGWLIPPRPRRPPSHFPWTSSHCRWSIQQQPRPPSGCTGHPSTGGVAFCEASLWCASQGWFATQRIWHTQHNSAVRSQVNLPEHASRGAAAGASWRRHQRGLGQRLL